MSMSETQVIREMCRITGLVYHSIGDYSHASDGFCDECLAKGLTFAHQGKSIDFIKDAVIEKLVRDGHDVRAGLKRMGMAEEVSSLTHRRMSMSKMKPHWAMDKGDWTRSIPKKSDKQAIAEAKDALEGIAPVETTERVGGIMADASLDVLRDVRREMIDVHAKFFGSLRYYCLVDHPSGSGYVTEDYEVDEDIGTAMLFDIGDVFDIGYVIPSHKWIPEGE